jgi:glycosyltransferase involved in cell wall biosynthesis
MTGLRVDGEKHDAVVEGLARVLTNREEARWMGLNGRARVLENFTHQRRVDQLRRLALRGRDKGSGSSVRAGESPFP